MKDWKQATDAELLEEVEAAAREQRLQQGVTALVGRIFAGKLTQEQVDAAQRKGYASVLPEMLEAFRQGYYFGQQGHDFLSHLMATEAEVEEDQKRWAHLKGAAEAMGSLGDPTFREAADFARSRVEPTFAQRRAFLNPDGKSLRTMDAKYKEAFTKRRDDFNSATTRWGWKQPFQK